MSDYNLKSHIVHPTLYMVGVGGVHNGYSFYGPFSGPGIATQWGDENLLDGVEFNIYTMTDVRQRDDIND